MLKKDLKAKKLKKTSTEQEVVTVIMIFYMLLSLAILGIHHISYINNTVKTLLNKTHE